MLISHGGVNIERVNNSIIEKLIKSRRFLKVLLKYLNCHIYQEQKVESSRKLLSLVKKWKKILEDGSDLFEDICSVIEEDPKFKIPWTVKEVSDAVEMFYEIFKINKKRN